MLSSIERNYKYLIGDFVIIDVLTIRNRSLYIYACFRIILLNVTRSGDTGYNFDLFRGKRLFYYHQLLQRHSVPLH